MTTEERLVAAGLDPAAVRDLARRALDEDLRGGVDVTTVATVPAEQQSVGEFRVRSPGVVAGLPVAAAFLQEAGDVEIDYQAADGDRVDAGAVVLVVAGRTRLLLTAERCALNVLGHLSGIATLTRRWVDAVAGTGAQVLDTRKTTPGLRDLEKYAVRCGGGSGFRLGLSDAAMVKDNHVLAAGGLTAAYRAVRIQFPHVPVEVECDTLDQVREALDAGADLLLLDNMGVEELRAAVQLVGGRARCEASGGLTLERAGVVAATGVDYLSVGALTNSAPVLDVGLDLVTKEA